MTSPFTLFASLLCLASTFSAAAAPESDIQRQFNPNEGVQAFSYTAGEDSPSVEGRGILLKSGQSYPIKGEITGPCAVYIAMVTPSPEFVATWGTEETRITANERFYYKVEEPFPPFQSIDIQGNLYGKNPAKEGEFISQEVLAGIGDFKNGPLTITVRNGEAHVTSVRFRKLSPEEYALAQHRNSPTENKTVIYNNDGYSLGFGNPDWDYRRLLEQLDVYANTDVKQLDWAPLVSGVVSYPSKHADWFGDGVTEWAREFERIASENYHKLENNGMPLFPTLVKRGKEIGVAVWGSLRMSGYYGDHPFGVAFNGKLWKQNPQFHIVAKDGSIPSAKRMSYAFEPVREQRLGVLVELAEMGCEGVSLDFCRYPIILGYETPLIEGFQKMHGVDPRTLEQYDGRWTTYRCELFNDFMRELKKRLAVVGEKRGERVQVSVRLPAGGYRDFGFDPETWIKEGLVDLLIVGWPSTDKPYDIKPWVKMVQGTKVQVYGNIERFIQIGKRFELTDEQVRQGIKQDPTTTYKTEDYLRRSAALYEDGVDGIHIFNNFASQIQESLGKVGDKLWIKRWSEFEDRAKLHSEVIKMPQKQ